MTRRSLSYMAAACLAAALAGCSDDAASGATAEAAELPTVRGDVWEIDPASPPDAQVLAFVNGVHTFVRKGDEIYTGTTRLKSVAAEDAVAAAQLPGDLTLRIEEREGQQTLVFSSGARAPLRLHEPVQEVRR